MDNCFKPRKRKNNVITINNGKVNSGNVEKKGKYDKRVKTNCFNASNIQDRLASMAKKPPTLHFDKSLMTPLSKSHNFL